MSKGKSYIIMLSAAVIALASAGAMSAQEAGGRYSFGSLHSPKSFALSLERSRDNGSFDMLNLGTDMYGIFVGKHAMPGIRCSLTRNIILDSRSLAGVDTRLYAGPGIVAGYVRDRDTGFGTIAGLSWTIGIQGEFDKRVALALDFESDIALFIRNNERYGTLDLSLYKLGLSRCFYPRLRIMYRFR